MERTRTLKEQGSLKQAQGLAEGLNGGQDHHLAVQVANVFALIAIHEVIDRLVDVVKDGVEILDYIKYHGIPAGRE